MWPERVHGLVTCGGYNIQNIAASTKPAAPPEEQRLWYQYYFHTQRGRAGRSANRYAFCRMLWQIWSPTWNFSETTYAQTASAFENADFVEVVIQSYRHRFGHAPGDPAYDEIEHSLTRQPPITVPSVILIGDDDGVTVPPPRTDTDPRFTGPCQRQDVPGAGHNLPQEKPRVVVDSVIHLLRGR